MEKRVETSAAFLQLVQEKGAEHLEQDRHDGQKRSFHAYP
jgi:hypothetical protein